MMNPAKVMQLPGAGALLLISLLLQPTLPAAAQAEGMTKVCEGVIEAQEASNLDPKTRSSLEYYKQVNLSENGRHAVSVSLLDDYHNDRSNRRQPDESPVSACLLKWLADESRFREQAAHAQEAYALRLLAGTGVARNPELALQYLERSARRGYQSAGMHLANWYLAQKPTAANKAKAIQWLEFTAFTEQSEVVGGWTAGPEQPIEVLLDLHIADKNFGAAEAVYRRARTLAYSKSMLAYHLKQIPGLKARIEAEEAEAARLAELRRRQAAERAAERVPQTCITYRNGYKSCR